MPAQPHARPGRARGGLLAAVALALPLLGGCLLDSGPTASPSESSSPAASVGASGGETPSPGASGSAAASPTPTAGELADGTYARVVVDGLRVRVSARADATPVGALFFGDVVRIRGSAVSAGGFTWYQVETVQTANDQPLLGYVAGAKGDERYLEALPGPPSPTPSHSPTPSPTASASASV